MHSDMEAIYWYRNSDRTRDQSPEIDKVDMWRTVHGSKIRRQRQRRKYTKALELFENSDTPKLNWLSIGILRNTSR